MRKPLLFLSWLAICAIPQHAAAFFGVGTLPENTCRLTGGAEDWPGARGQVETVVFGARTGSSTISVAPDLVRKIEGLNDVLTIPLTARLHIKFDPIAGEKGALLREFHVETNLAPSNLRSTAIGILLFDGDDPAKSTVNIHRTWKFPTFPDRQGLIPLSEWPFNPTPQAEVELAKILQAIRAGRTIVIALFADNTRILTRIEFSARTLEAMLDLADDQHNRLAVRLAAGECRTGDLSKGSEDWYRICRTLLGPINARRSFSSVTASVDLHMTLCGFAAGQETLLKRLKVLERARSLPGHGDLFGLSLPKQAP